MHVGMFRSEEGGVRVDYGTGGSIRSHDQSMRKTNTSQISINCHQKLSIGRQRKRKKMMPRGPKGEKRPAGSAWPAFTCLRSRNPKRNGWQGFGVLISAKSLGACHVPVAYRRI